VKLMRWWMLVACVAAVGCGGGGDSEPNPSPPPPHKAPGVVSVGRPIPPRFTREMGLPGWDELRAESPAADGRPVWRVLAMRQPPGRPRDFCVTYGLAAEDLAEADTECDLAAPRSAGAVSFVSVPGIQDRPGGPLTLISGVAPPGVRTVRVEGIGGVHTLPLSAHRAFAAVYASDAHGKVRLVSDRGDRKVVRSVKLPVPERLRVYPRHEYRRRGAVFGEEVGEPITGLSYRQILRRFGPPAFARQEQGMLCTYYEVVGETIGWQFCFRSNGQMHGALGNTKIPAH
jgi:hypothetical protein